MSLVFGGVGENCCFYDHLLSSPVDVDEIQNNATYFIHYNNQYMYVNNVEEKVYIIFTLIALKYNSYSY